MTAAHLRLALDGYRRALTSTPLARFGAYLGLVAVVDYLRAAARSS